MIILLSLSVLTISFGIVKFGDKAGLVILAGLLGLGLIGAAFFRPILGFYLCIALGFTISTFERIANSPVTFDFAVEIMVHATFLGIALRKYVRKEPFLQKTRHPINYILLAYLVFLTVELFNPNATSIAGALFYFRKTIELILIYLIALEVFQSYKSIRFFLYFWIAAAAFSGFYACLQQWIGFPSYDLRWIYEDDTRVAIYLLDNGTFRKFGTLTDPAAFGILMACSALLVIVLMARTSSWKYRFRFGAALIFIVLGMVYSGTRTATIALIVGVVLYILMTINNLKSLLFAVFCMMMFLFILFAPIYGNITINRVRSAFKFTHDESYNVRNENRAKVRPYMLSHPMGGGLMTTGIMGLKYNPDHFLSGFPPDSGLLKYALETGWIGLIFLCILYFVILQQGVHAFYRVKKPHAKAFLLAATVGLFANIMSQYSQVAIGATPEIFLFYSLIAIIVRISKLENNNTN